jgi:DNA polymerase III psi subunit
MVLFSLKLQDGNALNSTNKNSSSLPNTLHCQMLSINATPFKTQSTKTTHKSYMEIKYNGTDKCFPWDQCPLLLLPGNAVHCAL